MHKSKLKEGRVVRAPDAARTKPQRARTVVEECIASPLHTKRLHDTGATHLQRLRHRTDIKALTAAQIDTVATRCLRVSTQGNREFLRA